MKITKQALQTSRRNYTKSELSRIMSSLDGYEFILHIVGLENFLPNWKSKDPVLDSSLSRYLF